MKAQQLRTFLTDAAHAASRQAERRLDDANGAGIPEAVGGLFGAKGTTRLVTSMETRLQQRGMSPEHSASLAEAVAALGGAATTFGGSVAKRLAGRVGSQPLQEAAEAAARGASGAGAGGVASATVHASERAAQLVVK